MTGRNNVERSRNLSKESYPTPMAVISLVKEVLGEIELDPCSNPDSVVDAKSSIVLPVWEQEIQIKLSKFIFDDGLNVSWNKKKVFCNPPYGREFNKIWAEKITKEAQEGCEIIALVPSSPGTKWWKSYRPKSYGGKADACCLWEGRIKFHNAPAPADFESAIIYFGPNVDKFKQTFKDKGWVI